MKKQKPLTEEQKQRHRNAVRRYQKRHPLAVLERGRKYAASHKDRRAGDINWLMGYGDNAIEERLIREKKYRAFLEAKVALAGSCGIDVGPLDVNPILKPHQRESVIWGVRGGRRAWFEAFGLGKTVIQLETLRLILATDATNGYADVPVVKAKPLCDDHGRQAPFNSRTNWKQPIPGTGYSRAKWQFDAHGFNRQGGDRLLSSEELRSLPHEKIYKLWKARSSDIIHDHEGHIAIAEELDYAQRLPASFMLLPPHSWHPDVWTDITRMRTLNMLQERKGQEMHLCPMQFDIAERVIEVFSMPGETVYDPFAGIGTVPMMAVKMDRVGIGCELSPGYFADAVSYCRSAEMEVQTPTLFDLLACEEG